MKKNITHHYLLILIVLLLASSCMSTKSITIEIPQKAPKELPGHIQSLVLLNRTIDDNFSNLESDSLQKIFYKENFSVDTLYYDLQAADTMLTAIGELLYESGRYDYVIPEDRLLSVSNNPIYTRGNKWPEVKEICQTYNTDGLLSVDVYKTRVMTNFEKDEFYNENTDGFVSVSTAQMIIIYNVLIQVYDPFDEKVLLQEFFKDTLLWENAATSTRKLFEDFTPVKQALSEASVAVALDFTEKISTVWKRESRPIYVKGDADLKYAGTLIDEQEWKKAMKLWKEIASTTKSKATKSKAQFNIAVAYEISGDIENAISWALESYNTMYSQLTYQYLELLEKRKKEIEKHTK